MKGISNDQNKDFDRNEPSRHCSRSNEISYDKQQQTPSVKGTFATLDRFGYQPMRK